MKRFLLLSVTLGSFSLFAQEGKGKLELTAIPSPAPVFISELNTSSKRELKESAFDDVSTDDRLVCFPDITARYPGGQEAMNQYVIAQIEIAEERAKEDLKGQILIEFVVEKDGSLSELHVKNSTNDRARKAAEEIVKDCPEWIPALKDGAIVRSKGSMLINFDLVVDEI